jgi:hypothetical protein
MPGSRHERRAYDFTLAGETLRPLRDQLLVKVLPLKLSSTILADWRGAAVRGQVIAAGPGTYPNIHKSGKRDGKDYRTIRPSGVFRPTEVKVGQIVHLGGMELNGYLFQKLFIANEEHIVCSEKDVCGVEND